MGQNESKLRKKKERKERAESIEEIRAILRRTLYQVHHQDRFTIAPTHFDELAKISFQQEKAKMKVNSLLATVKTETKKKIMEKSTIDAEYITFKDQPKPSLKNGRKLKRLQVGPPKATKVGRHKKGKKDGKIRTRLEIVVRDTLPETEVRIPSQSPETVPDSDDIMYLHVEIKSLATVIFESNVEQVEKVPKTKSITDATLKAGQSVQPHENCESKNSKDILKLETPVGRFQNHLMKVCREMMTSVKPTEINEEDELKVKSTNCDLKQKNDKKKNKNLENQVFSKARLREIEQSEEEKKSKKNSCWKCLVPNWLLRRFDGAQEVPKDLNKISSKRTFKGIFKKKNKVAPEMVSNENEIVCGGIASATIF